MNSIMEILFMVFMVIVSIMALFAVMVVFRDIVKEMINARKERENGGSNVDQINEDVKQSAVVTVINNPMPEKEKELEPEPEPEPEIIPEPVIEPVIIEDPAPVEEDPDGTVKFAAGQKQTLEEKYLELSPEARGWYDEIMKYAANVEGSKRFKNARYEEYKVGNNRIIRMLIKRGVINCEFILHNQNFKNYVNENKISVKQGITTMLIESPETVEAAKNSIDIVVAAIAEEREYKKQLARERRKAAKEAAAAAEAAKEAESAKK